jgi:hypothetical protein
MKNVKNKDDYQKNSNNSSPPSNHLSLIWNNVKIQNKPPSSSSYTSSSSLPRIYTPNKESKTSNTNLINNSTRKCNGGYIEYLTESIVKSLEKDLINKSSSSHATHLYKEKIEKMRENYESGGGVFTQNLPPHFKFISNASNFYHDGKFQNKHRPHPHQHNFTLPYIEYYYSNKNDDDNKNKNKKKRRKHQYTNTNANQDWMYGLYDAAQAFLNRQAIEKEQQLEQQAAKDKPEPGMIAKKKAPKIKVNYCQNL